MRLTKNTLSALLIAASAAASWQPLGPPGVPALRLAASPDGQRLAFSTSSAIWLSQDGGQSWERCPLPLVEVREILFHPQQPEDLVALVTGWPGLGHRPVLALGRQGGRQWLLKWVAPEDMNFSSLLPDPWFADTFLLRSWIGPRQGIYRLHPDGRLETLLRVPEGISTWAAVPGQALWVGTSSGQTPLYLSTDGGFTWRKVFTPRYFGQYVYPSDIVVNPHNAAHIILLAYWATYISQDAGKTWSSGQGIPFLVGKASISPADPRQLWVLCGGKLCHSSDGGFHWMEISLPSGNLTDVLPHPTNPLGLWLATSTPVLGLSWPGVLASEDGGQSFQPLTQEVAALPVKEIHPLPGPAPQVVARSILSHSLLEDQAWRPLLLEDGTAFDLVVPDPHLPGRLYASTSLYVDYYGDALFLSEDGGVSWRQASPILPRQWCEQIAPDPFDANLVLAGLRFGAALIRLDTGELVGGWGRGSATVETVAFLPDRPGVALAASSEIGLVARSTDHGMSWQEVSAPPLPNFYPWRLVPATGGYVYLHTEEDGGRLLLSRDMGETWTPIPLPASHCGPPEPAPNAPEDLVVGCGLGTNGWRLFRSLDAGASWQPLAGLAGLEVTTLRRDPTDPERVYLGTARHGLWWGPLEAAVSRPRKRLPRPPALALPQAGLENATTSFSAGESGVGGPPEPQGH